MAEPSRYVREAKRVQSARPSMIRWARKSSSVFAQYVLRDEETGGPIRLSPTHKAWHQLCDEHRNVLIWSHVESGKAVPVDTPIPTPDGWRTMGDLSPGDRVFASDGRRCSVTYATPVQFGNTVYRVSFDDGDSMLADADHQWIAATIDDPRPRPAPSMTHVGDGDPCACGCGLAVVQGNRYVHNHHRRVARSGSWRVVTTAGMLSAGINRRSGAKRPDRSFYEQSRWRIPLCGPAQYPERDLPVPPYVLGAWLGDGDTNSPTLTFHEKDRFVFDRCRELVGTYDPIPDSRNPSVLRASLGPGALGRRPGPNGDPTSLRGKLRALGVLGDKRIPAAYLTASVAQRRELLAGLLDTDGYVSTKARNASQVEISSKVRALAEDTLELARSLGFKARLKSSRSMLYGRVVGMRHRVFFTAREPVFRLPRKLKAQNIGWLKSRARYRCVVGIEQVESVPVRCIAVDSIDSSYLMGRSYTVTHNTWEMMSRTLWEIGLNPNSRWIILSNTKNQASKWISTLKDYIDKSEEVHEVFPKLRRGSVWGEYRFTVDRTSIAKDPTVQAAGVYGNVMGSRADGVILDDILDLENTTTKDQRDKLWKWLKATVHGRLTRKSVMRVIGTAFHPQDAMHRYARQPNFSAFRYPAIDDSGNPRWPERFSLERIEEKRVDLGPIEFARQMMCVARDDSTARFKKEWIDRCLALGNGKSLCSALKKVPDGYRVITGVDLAVSKSDAADLTVFFTIAVRPDGKREVLSIESGKMSGPEIVKKVFDVHERYQSIIIVENNSSQDFILQFARDRGALPIRPFTTGRNKAHPEFGIESLAAEMSAGAWVIPNHDGVMHPEVEAWVDDMLYYDPRAHTGDHLMASWFAREGVRLGAITAETGRLDITRR